MESIKVEEENLEEIAEEDAEESKGKMNRVYCANCLHCILVKVPTVSGKDSPFRLRVKCSMGKWKKKLGAEKLYKYFSVFRRIVSDCDSYEEMGELKTYLRDLRKSLPQSDETYRR